MSEIEFIDDVRGGGRRTVVIEGPWAESFRELIVADQLVDRLLYHPGRDVTGSVDFLLDLPQIRTVSIAQSRSTNVHALARCRWLEHIGITEWSGEFPSLSGLCELQTVGIDHGRGAERVLQLEQIKHLAYGRFPYGTLENVGGLNRLESLRLTYGRLVSTEGIGRFGRLSLLALVHCRRLESIVDLDDLQQLRTLDVDACGALPDFEELGRLHRLEELYIQSRGSAPTIRPLARCTALRKLILTRVRVEDGSVRFLLDLPGLVDARVGTAQGYDISYRELYEHTRARRAASEGA